MTYGLNLVLETRVSAHNLVSTFYTIDGYNIKYKIDSSGNVDVIGKMIEFVLKNRKLRLHPDGIMYARAHHNGVETKKETWREIKFSSQKGYISCCMIVDGVKINLYKHRLVYYAHNQDWDIWDSSQDNSIDHINHIRDDNRIENLRRVNNQQNQFNRICKGYHRCGNKWRAVIYLDGKRTHIGLFETEEDARNAYIEKKLELHII